MPHEFLTRLRIERAKTLLASGSHNVTEVCFEVGVSSLGSFSALFANRVGLSPSEYRRHVRSGVAVPREIRGALGIGVFETNDINGDYERLGKRGVEFMSPPREQFYGTEAIVKDNSGNWFGLTQPKK
ncbi:MAG TPA: helix-turn-helix domain-containing protein [Rubrobacteraceae bacterium]|nr:helix-turn-helix domain-containing protein [Rubrobacteraceae bacterium]